MLCCWCLKMLIKVFLFILFVCLTTWCQVVSTAPSIEDQDTTEAPPCNKGEFRCKDGTCVAALSRCNGTAECADASDETFALCRNDRCGEGQFRCAYGACVRGAPCDGVQHCYDNSDEILIRCLPETDRTVCNTSIESDGIAVLTCSIQTDCENGQWLANEDKCDGKTDCADGSDETVARCGEVICGEDQFRCAYGGCTHKYAMCNGILDCADRSDESYDLCNRSEQISSRFLEDTTLGPLYTSCILPPFPENGAYTKLDNPGAAPDDRLEAVLLNFTCEAPYAMVGKPLMYCLKGVWSDEFPKCLLFCSLPRDHSVDYHCLLSGNNSLEGYRICNDWEPSGTKVKPVCKSPTFYYPGTLTLMHCEDGNWDYKPMCTPECGRATPKGSRLVAGGRSAERDELPWHASIYSKLKSPYEQICGGSVLSTKVIISAAHCFWNEYLQPASNYAVAVGKLNRAWYDPEDEHTLRRDVLAIMIPPRYRGAETNFQDDLALVVVKRAIYFSVHVRPVCVDFDYEFDTRQLQPNNLGKVAGWGLTSADGTPSPILNVVELPYVSIEQCLAETPFSYKEYITADKICAGYKNGTSVCRGDSGGGLVFPEMERGILRYYLRGIVSTAPGNEHSCNILTVTSFTHILKHEHFIKSHFETFDETGFQYFETRLLPNYYKN